MTQGRPPKRSRRGIALPSPSKVSRAETSVSRPHSPSPLNTARRPGSHCTGREAAADGQQPGDLRVEKWCLPCFLLIYDVPQARAGGLPPTTAKRQRQDKPEARLSGPGQRAGQGETYGDLAGAAPCPRARVQAGLPTPAAVATAKSQADPAPSVTRTQAGGAPTQRGTVSCVRHAPAPSQGPKGPGPAAPAPPTAADGHPWPGQPDSPPCTAGRAAPQRL